MPWWGEEMVMKRPLQATQQLQVVPRDDAAHAEADQVEGLAARKLVLDALRHLLREQVQRNRAVAGRHVHGVDRPPAPGQVAAEACRGVGGVVDAVQQQNRICCRIRGHILPPWCR